MKKSILFFIISISLFKSFSICLIENNKALNISIDKFYKKNEVGKNGALALLTNFYDEEGIFNQLDIEEKTKFKGIISYNTYNDFVDCRLWIYKEKNRDLIVFCNVDETIPKGKYYLSVNSIKINYMDYEINLETSENLLFEKLDLNIVDLYSDEQRIVVEDNKNEIELKFKINSYVNEKLILFKELTANFIDDCRTEKKELKCLFPKSKLEEIMAVNEEQFLLYYIREDNTFNKIELVNNITIIYNFPNKKDVFISITNVLEKTAEHNTFIAYEAKVIDTEISNLATPIGSFKMKFNGGEGRCALRKYEKSPLIMICQADDGVSSLGKIEKQIDLDNINIKYNFKIQPGGNDETINVSHGYSGSIVLFSYPELLDFTYKDNLKVVYQIENPKGLFGIRFNTDGKDLICEDFTGIKICTVPKTHFYKKKSGYYFITHKNHLNGQSICYEAPPIKVIAPKLNGKKINISWIISLFVFFLL